jgi:hypothetical protein
VVAELREIGKPFAIILNSAHPSDEESIALAYELEEKYSAPVALVSCIDLDFDDMPEQMRSTGIKSICSVVEKHNGNCRFVAGAGQFECIVIMDA